MNDLRGFSRGSKAAAVVILAVLLQVIVIAVVGLGAISRDREAGARAVRETEERIAEATASATRDRMLEGLRSAVHGAATAALTARDPGGERAFPRHGAGSAFGSMMRVDAEGRERSFGGTLLHVPLETAAREEQAADLARREELRTLIDVVGRDVADGDADVAEARRELVRAFPYWVDSADWPQSAGHALALAEQAVDAAAGRDPSGPEALAAQRALLVVRETTVRVRSRAPSSERVERNLAWISAQVARLAARLPGGAGPALLEGLADLDRVTEAFQAVRGRVVEDARFAARATAPPRVFALRGGDAPAVVAIASLPAVEGRTSEALVVQVDARILASIAEEEGVPAAGREQGLSTRVIARSDPSPAAPVLRRALVTPPDFDPGLDVVVVRSGAAPPTPPTGPREVFYWTILGLAALGLTVAGVVLIRLLRREVHLARLKSDFVSNLSHELKTPLTSIGLFVEMVRDGRASTGPELAEAMEVIAAESERLQRIVGRMIDVARREASPAAMALAPGDLNAPVRAAAERFRRLERGQRLDLVVDLAPALPPVRLDPAAIDDVVTNLLSNAWKYRRGDAARVRVSTRAARRRVEVLVEDDGIGIPRRERRRVFEMFYRADDFLSRAVPGTGLGLALVRTIVRAHRGRVRIEPSTLGGTAFRIRFPAARARVASTSAPAAPSAASARPAREPAGGGAR